MRAAGRGQRGRPAVHSLSFARPSRILERTAVLPAALLTLAALGAGPAAATPSASAPPKVVFVVGDEEYRSEESMPMLAAILERRHGIDATVLFSQTDGKVDPMRLDNLPGLEALDDADLMVLFTRWRALPPEQMDRIVAYVESGRPVVGFRTGTHPFKYPAGSPYAAWNERKIAALVGQRWIVHHGHFADGEAPLTRVTAADGGTDSPILNGVGTPFAAYSWLYHVTGGGDALAPGSTPLLTGETLRSNKLAAGQGNRYPPVQPVAWTKTNPFSPDDAAPDDVAPDDAAPDDVEPGRVFFTTLGHPYDFQLEPVRRLAVQGVLWALGREGEIPPGGVNAEPVAPYAPTNSGFGGAISGRTPAQILTAAGLRSDED